MAEARLFFDDDVSLEIQVEDDTELGARVSVGNETFDFEEAEDFDQWIEVLQRARERFMEVRKEAAA